MRATLLARRPRATPLASTTYHSPLRSSFLAVQVFCFVNSSLLVDHFHQGQSPRGRGLRRGAPIAQREHLAHPLRGPAPEPPLGQRARDAARQAPEEALRHQRPVDELAV